MHQEAASGGCPGVRGVHHQQHQDAGSVQTGGDVVRTVLGILDVAGPCKYNRKVTYIKY